jgi:hypothetical protein
MNFKLATFLLLFMVALTLEARFSGGRGFGRARTSGFGGTRTGGGFSNGGYRSSGGFSNGGYRSGKSRECVYTVTIVIFQAALTIQDRLVSSLKMLTGL